MTYTHNHEERTMNAKAIEKSPEGDKSLQPGPASELPVVTSSIGNMLFEPGVFERVIQMSEIMAKSKAMVPQYLRGNQSDCMAIIMQAAQWKMDPFAVAAKTYQIRPGAPIGYEAQLVNSIIIINGPFKERPKYEFYGAWGRVQGKLKEMRSDKGKYAVPDWKPEDEEGLGVTVTLQVIGEDEPTSMDVLLKQCWPRNSTNWANDPQQQICYAAIRKMARRHFPDVVMGLYTPDELTHVQPEEKDVTPANSLDDLLPSKTDTPAEALYFKETVDPLLALRPVYAERKRALTPKQDAKADETTETVDQETGEIQGNAKGVDPATLMKMVETADSLESLDEIMEMTAGMDKRSKAYKELVNMVGIRTGEMTEGAESE
jgi:hypothetical protein